MVSKVFGLIIGWSLSLMWNSGMYPQNVFIQQCMTNWDRFRIARVKCNNNWLSQTKRGYNSIISIITWHCNKVKFKASLCDCESSIIRDSSKPMHNHFIEMKFQCYTFKYRHPHPPSIITFHQNLLLISKESVSSSSHLQSLSSILNIAFRICVHK